jgi:hypothetical protein
MSALHVTYKAFIFILCGSIYSLVIHFLKLDIGNIFCFVGRWWCLSVSLWFW